MSSNPEPQPNIQLNIISPSAGEISLAGFWYGAANPQAPLALFLHGIPGTLKNHDIATALYSMGWSALVLHFPGAWGSGGDYNLAEHPHTVSAALDALLAVQGISPQKVAPVGFSLGSRAALLSAVTDTRLGAVVSISGICDFTEVLFERPFFENMPPLLRGTSVDSLQAQIADLGLGLQPYEAIQQIAPRPVLVLHGTSDEIVPFYHADALSMTGAHIQRLTIAGANHTYDEHRAELIAGVTDFLSAWRDSE